MKISSGIPAEWITVPAVEGAQTARSRARREERLTMNNRVLVVARDRDIRTVFDPMLHLYDMVLLRANSIEAARDLCHVTEVHGVIVQGDFCGVASALDFFTTLRCSIRHCH